VNLIGTDASSLVIQIGYSLVFLLLAGVTGGIVYLTLVEWRDKRRRMEIERGQRQSRKR
jgi:hypothetical protein